MVNFMTKTIKIDYFILISIIFFYIISMISIKSASIYLSTSLGNLVLKQSIWYLLGILLIFIIIRFNNSFFYKWAFVIYGCNCLLLLGLLFFGTEINGSRCWYNIFGFSFQPSEFMKISLILVYSNLIGEFNRKKKIDLKSELSILKKIFIIWLIPSLLTFLEPDTGAVLIYSIVTFFCLFVSKIRIRFFASLGIILTLLIIVFFYGYFYQQDLFIGLLGNDFFYRMDRIINWQTGSGMQLENSMTAIAASGILGFGFKNTPIYFPEAGTDFIFGVFASNFGFLGSSLLITYLALFNIYIINLITKKSNYRDKTLLIGIIGIMFYQQIQNIGMTIGLLPITGITLPFISYGGSSLLSYLILMGFVLNINKKEKKY